MKINIYKNQKEIEKTFEVKTYDIMYGTVQDILSIIDEAGDLSDEDALYNILAKNMGKIDELLLDIFGDEGLVREDLRNIKVKELVPIFVELFVDVQKAFESKN